MKGVMGFLEKAGLVRMDTSHDDAAPPTPPIPAPAVGPAVASSPEASMPSIGTPLKLDDSAADL